MNLTQEGSTYTLSGLTDRQVGLLFWMADTVLIAAHHESAIGEDASSLYTATGSGPAGPYSRRVAAGIDNYSGLSELDGIVRYAPTDE